MCQVQFVSKASYNLYGFSDEIIHMRDGIKYLALQESFSASYVKWSIELTLTWVLIWQRISLHT